MKIGIVGAGPAGLCTIKEGLAFGCEVTAFEQTDKIGGTWNYTDETEKDKRGLDVHSSMYQGLRTNIPKEIMGFPEYPIESDRNASYLTSHEILKYLHSYAETFDLMKHIKLEHHVVQVRPLLNDKWEFTVNNLVAGKCEKFVFDAVVICNGYSIPFMPKIPGQNIFKGRQVHSHHFRTSKDFEGQDVLVIGGGPSGVDLTVEISKTARKVYWSNHNVASYGKKIFVRLPDSTSEKCDVVKLTENGAEFSDGSFEELSTIMYATGYDYKFPFLSIDCGLYCHEKYVQPLYKHLINIHRPTMAIIGLPYFAIANSLFDLQIRFFLTFLTGRKQFPSKEEMLEDTEQDMNERWKRLKKYKAHLLGLEKHSEYYKDLAKTADIEGIKPVFVNIFNKSFSNYFVDFNKFREFNFKVIDEENYKMWHPTEERVSP